MMHIWWCILPIGLYLFQDVVTSLLTPPHFETLFYVPKVGGFLVDALFYCDVRPTPQPLELVHSNIFKTVTTFSHGGAKYVPTFFDAISIHKSTRFDPLFFNVT
jgi:hypothetical protein